MASPEEQAAAQARNLEARTRRSLADWADLVRATGLEKHGEMVARIQRFQSVLRACGDRSTVDWLELAHAHGYADQPHLIREFRRLAGVTPREFLARRTADPAHLVVA